MIPRRDRADDRVCADDWDRAPAQVDRVRQGEFARLSFFRLVVILKILCTRCPECDSIFLWAIF